MRDGIMLLPLCSNRDAGQEVPRSRSTEKLTCCTPVAPTLESDFSFQPQKILQIRSRIIQPCQILAELSRALVNMSYHISGRIIPRLFHPSPLICPPPSLYLCWSLVGVACVWPWLQQEDYLMCRCAEWDRGVCR